MAIVAKDFIENEQIIHIFYKNDILVKKDNHTILPTKEVFNLLKKNDVIENCFLDTFTNIVFSEVKQDCDFNKIYEQINDYEFIALRLFFHNACEKSAALAARAMSYLRWIKATKYCCTCGKSLVLEKNENALKCEGCGKTHYPRIEPCIIVLIYKDDRFLLLRHAYRNQDLFTCLAGFMEAGESAEECVKREVFEEVGLKIKNIKYKGSQSWPFPDQLMLAFTADYESGEIVLQKEEITEAKWFYPKEIENFNFPGSVAWKLIYNKF